MIPLRVRQHFPENLHLGWSVRWVPGISLAGLLLTTGLSRATAAPPGVVREPDLRVTPAWLAGQLIPSVGTVAQSDRWGMALGWQVTPVLWSHGIDPRLSPWRFFIAEPIVRTSGSMELFLAPEYWGVFPAVGDRFGGKIGVRSTLPLIERGDNLAVSLATTGFYFPADYGVSYEAGLHTLFGIFGVTLAPHFGTKTTTWQAMLRVRVF